MPKFPAILATTLALALSAVTALTAGPATAAPVPLASPNEATVAHVQPHLLKDITSGKFDKPSRSSAPAEFFSVGSTTIFRANDFLHGTELWKSNGTSTCTTLLKDVNSTKLHKEWTDTLSATPTGLTRFGTKTVFAADGGSGRREVWITDGTASGTKRIKGDVVSSPRSTIYGFTSVGARFFFVVEYADAGRTELWVSDGTAKGTKKVTPLDRQAVRREIQLVALAGKVYFNGYSAATGWELWSSDGTKTGTRIVKDYLPGQQSYLPSGFTVAGGTMFYSAFATPGSTLQVLFASDGTAGGTRAIRTDLGAPNTPGELTPFGNRMALTASSSTRFRQLWVSDGTASGTTMITLNDSVLNAKVGSLAVAGNRIYFAGTSGVAGKSDVELWSSDGTRAGTRLVKDIAAGATGSFPEHLTAVGTTIVFVADTNTAGREPWVSDGTAAGTKLLRDIRPGTADSRAVELTASRGRIYFAADNGTNGLEPFVFEPGPTYLSTTTVSVASKVAYGKGATVTVKVTSAKALSAKKVALYDGKKKLATLTLKAGAATYTLPRTLAVGVHKLTAAYTGAGAVKSSTSCAIKTLTVTKVAASVGAALAKATVKPTAQGSVTVTVKAPNVTPAGALTVSITKAGMKTKTVKATLKASHKGKLTIKLPKLAVGKYGIKVTYAGSSTVAKATSKTVTLTVKK